MVIVPKGPIHCQAKTSRAKKGPGSLLFNCNKHAVFPKHGLAGRAEYNSSQGALLGEGAGRGRKMSAEKGLPNARRRIADARVAVFAK